MALVLEGVTKYFKEFKAVDDLSFTVEPGSVMGFLGANGAGKTTTLRMILNILVPDAGWIAWNGHPLTYEISRRFGYLPEERGLYPKMRVGEQLLYLTSLRGGAKDQTKNTKEWLERLNIAEHWDKRVEQLSKGNQQKVQFVAAVLHHPDLIILDEPFSGLDPLSAQVVQQSLQELNRQGKTVIFSSHRLEQVDKLCTHVTMIHRSRLVFSGTLSQIKRTTQRQLVHLSVEGSLDFLDRFPGIIAVDRLAAGIKVEIPTAMDPHLLLRAAMEAGKVTRFELTEPSLEEIYLEQVRRLGA